MASSGTFTTSASYERSLKFDWWVNSQSQSGNSTNIGWNLIGAGKEYSTSGGRYYVKCGPIKVYINGSLVYDNSTRVQVFFNDIVATGSTTIYHDSAGNGNISASVEAAIYSGSINCYGSGNWSLPTIARNPSTISATNATIGGKSTISISKANSSFTHTLRYDVAGTTGTIVSKTSSSSYSWTVPTSLYSKVTSGKSVKCTIYCDTYSGGTLVGTKSTSITLSIDEAAKPILNPTVVDTNEATIALTGNANKLVRYYSRAKFAFNASGQNNASISSYYVSNGAYGMSTSTGTFNEVGSDTFTFTVTDSYGLTSSKTIYVDMVDYVYLTCNCIPKVNINGTAVIKISGNCFEGNFGKANNTLTVMYRYKEDGGEYPSSWTTATAERGINNTYTASVALSGFDYRKTYVFQALAYDSLDEVVSSEISATATPIYDWGMNDFTFNVPVSFRGGILEVENLIGDAKGDWVIEQGTVELSGFVWTYRKWNSGIAECWGSLVVNTAVNTAWGNLYVSGSLGATNIQFPFYFEDIPNINVSLSSGTAGAFLLASGSAAASTSKTGGYEIARGSASSTAQYYRLNYDIRGRWK